MLKGVWNFFPNVSTHVTYEILKAYEISSHLICRINGDRQTKILTILYVFLVATESWKIILFSLLKKLWQTVFYKLFWIIFIPCQMSYVHPLGNWALVSISYSLRWSLWFLKKFKIQNTTIWQKAICLYLESLDREFPKWRLYLWVKYLVRNIMSEESTSQDKQLVWICIFTTRFLFSSGWIQHNLLTPYKNYPWQLGFIKRQSLEISLSN